MRTMLAGSVLIAASLILVGPSSAETNASVTCKDGTTATAGRGACSHHGGVAKDSGSAAATSSAPSGGATVNCKDGTTAAAGRGACSHHGGVAKSSAGAPAAGAAPAAASAPVAAAAKGGSSSGSTAKGGKAASTDPTGALAKCHDGMYWHGTKHSGACSHHGGVDAWLDGSK